MIGQERLRRPGDRHRDPRSAAAGARGPLSPACILGLAVTRDLRRRWHAIARLDQFLERHPARMRHRLPGLPLESVKDLPDRAQVATGVDPLSWTHFNLG